MSRLADVLNGPNLTLIRERQPHVFGTQGCQPALQRLARLIDENKE